MRPRVLCLIALFGLALALVARAGLATSWPPRTDLQIVALDLDTGALKWRHVPPSLGNAHFELYPGLLVAYPHYDQRDRSAPIFLDPTTGRPAKDTRGAAAPRARSGALWPNPPVALDNGWQLAGFSPGNTKDLAFTQPGSSKVVWTIRAAHYPERVAAYKDIALHAYGYLTKEAVLQAHRAGSPAPTWTIDFNALLATTAANREGRVAMQVIDDVVYAQVGEHIFAIRPDTGRILWRTAAAKATKLAYRPDLYGGALDVATFTRERNVLVVAFENRVFALAADSGRVLWHVAPDTFPHAAFPLAKDGLVYVIGGPKRAAPMR